MKKAVFLLVVILFLMTNGMAVSSDNDDAQLQKYELNYGLDLTPEFITNQADALELHRQLLSAFSAETPVSQKSSELTYSGLYAEQYPEEYAGAYINSDGNLVVLVTNRTNDSSGILETTLASRSSDVEYRVVEYSYGELLNIMNIAYPFLGTTEFGFELLSTSIDDYNNCVVVTLRELDDNAIDHFKQTVSDSDAIIFKEATGNATMEASINSGIRVNNLSTNGAGSIGFRCRRQYGNEYQYGFVTAKHVISTNESAGYNQISIGTCVLSYDIYDCAFVNVTNENYSISNSIGYTGKSLAANSFASIVQGSSIYKYGFTTSETLGQILSSSSNEAVGNQTRSDCFLANYSSDEGDSGGTVYCPGSTNSSQLLAGIHLGRNISGYAYGSKAANIVSLMNLTRY